MGKKREPVVATFLRGQYARSIDGADQMREVFIDRDLEGLAKVLREHPESWKAELCIMRRTRIPGKDNMHEGPIAHFAIAYGWTAAIKILAAGGDTLDTPHPDTGHTPIFHAARYGRTAVVLQLMKMGKSLNSDDGSVLENLVKSQKSTRGRNSVAETAVILVQAGQDPWKQDRHGKSLPMLCVESRQLDLCATLLSLKSGPEEEYDTIHRAFIDQLSTSIDEKVVLHFLDALQQLGRAPSLSFMTQTLEKWCAGSPGEKQARNWGREDMLLKLIERRAESPMDVEDAKAAHQVLSQFTRIKPKLISNLEAAMLSEATVGTVPSIRRRSL
jgi:hypothetical protein